MTEKIKVLIVDDSRMIRDVLTDILADQPDIEVVGGAADAFEARDMIRDLKPDVITLEEVSANWQPRLEQIAAMYPFATVCQAPRRIGGVAIVSRRPIAAGGAGKCLDGGSLALAPIDFGGPCAMVASGLPSNGT